MPALRIAMLGPFGLRPKGTMAVRALPLAQALANRGHSVKVIMPAWHTPHEAPRTWQEGDVALEYVPLGPLPGHAAAPWIVRRMLRSALAWSPHVVHAFKPKAYAGLTAWRLWQRRHRPGAPALLVDEDDWEGRGGWEAVEAYPPAQRALFRWQERWGLTHCHGVTVASQALQTLAWSLGAPPAQVTYLPNGSTLPPLDAPPAAAPPVVLLYTRFAEFDPARPVAVLQALAERVPAVRLRVVGQALDPARDAAFDRAVAAAGLEARVERCGWAPLEELPALLAGCRLALWPFDDDLINRCKCSVKLADLLRLGLPVVADAVGEVGRYVAHGETGWLTPPGDVAAMVERAAQLLGDAALAERMGQAARRRYETLFDWNHLAITAEAAYERALDLLQHASGE